MTDCSERIKDQRLKIKENRNTVNVLELGSLRLVVCNFVTYARIFYSDVMFCANGLVRSLQCYRLHINLLRQCIEP